MKILIVPSSLLIPNSECWWQNKRESGKQYFCGFLRTVHFGIVPFCQSV